MNNSPYILAPASVRGVMLRVLAALLPGVAVAVGGEVLVAVGVDPGWTPIFAKLAALVTESGGQLSHPAVGAREYGLPAVLAVPGATRRLQAGGRVRVDGTTGTVTRLSAQPGGNASVAGG